VLPRANRIVDGEHLRSVSRKGSKFRAASFVAAMVVTDDLTPSRFGFIVSKGVGGAVVRNLVKRRLRALAAEALLDHPQGFDLVVRAQAPSAQASYEQLSAQWATMMRTLVS